MIALDWQSIRIVGTTKNDGFEEFVCQLARNSKPEGAKDFFRKGKPDGGVECFWTFENGDEWAWQAKYFTSSLENNQWQQLDESVKSALDKHDNLKKYIIAIPNDPPDSRREDTTSMLQKWEKRITKWSTLARKKNKEVEFVAWWSSDMINKLQLPENEGMIRFWFDSTEFTDDWLQEQTLEAIEDLGNRYSPEINVELEIVKYFDSLNRDASLEKQIQNEFTPVLKYADDVIKYVTDTSEPLKKQINELINQIRDQYQNINWQGVSYIPLEDLKKQVKELVELSSQYSTLITERQEKLDQKVDNTSNKSNFEEVQKYHSKKHTIQEFHRSTRKLSWFLDTEQVRLLNTPCLLIEGDAGVGKSHLLADVVKMRSDSGLATLFILGQKLLTKDNPRSQILTNLELDGNFNEFLGALNAKAQSTGKRGLIFIDALNEGQGKYIWPDNIKSIILKVTSFDWLGLVLSVRTSYKELIFDSKEGFRESIITFEHYGFAENTYEATKRFFSYYNIELPSIPVLHPEFHNPLFLKLFCEGLRNLGMTKIPEGLKGFTKVIENYIDSVNIVLSKPNRLNFDRNLHVVQKVTSHLIQQMIQQGNYNHVSYDTAYLITQDISRIYCGNNQHLLEELISEGILQKNLLLDENEGVYFAYERFSDHMIVSEILSSVDDIKELFDQSGIFSKFKTDINEMFFQKGIIEALSIQLPEKFGVELYECIPETNDSEVVASSFVDSLLWRDVETITENSVEYINSTVLRCWNTYNQFFDTILSVCMVPDHYFNADFLHGHLEQFSIADRDAWWNSYLKYQLDDVSSVQRLIDWATRFEDKSYVEKDSIRLSAIAIAWFLPSTNRKLRDLSTKALICLLENDIEILIDVLKKFKNINDPYIYERLLAVAYGCALRSKQDSQNLLTLSLYVFEAIFNVEGEVYPHILIRDYAKNIIEYTKYLGFELTFDLSKISPPYNSSIPHKQLTTEEIDEKYSYTNSFHNPSDMILSSMTPERSGRKGRMYGDFGRYVFQSALYSWDVNAVKLSNFAIERIFEKYGYSVEQHGNFDISVGSGRARDTHPHERIGKKYQWMVFHEVLARVADNFQMSEKYYHLPDEQISFQGSWDPYVRDIDPTTMLSKTESSLWNDKYPVSNWWFDKTSYSLDFENPEWLKNDTDLPNPKELIELTDNDGKAWLVLSGNPEWSNKPENSEYFVSGGTKELWYQLRGCLVSKSEKTQLINYLNHGNQLPREILENQQTYQVFYREYYWSPAFYDLYRNTDGTVDECRIIDPESSSYVASVKSLTNFYSWESEYDYSKEDRSIGFLIPSIHIFEGMSLKHSKNDGEFVNQTDELICFTPNIKHASYSYFLVKKEPFMTFLEENEIDIVWVISGEKQYIGSSFHTLSHNRLEIKGVYSIEGGDVCGNVSAQYVDHNASFHSKPARTNHLSQLVSCKYCDGLKIIKYGKSPKGKQRYKCKSCERTFTERAK